MQVCYILAHFCFRKNLAFRHSAAAPAAFFTPFRKRPPPAWLQSFVRNQNAVDVSSLLSSCFLSSSFTIALSVISNKIKFTHNYTHLPDYRYCKRIFSCL